MREGSNLSFRTNNTGVWCNGNTWVSEALVPGSNPSTPTKALHGYKTNVYLLNKCVSQNNDKLS